MEMIDRFGLLPEPTKTLFRVALLRQRCEALGIRRVDAGPTGGKVEFGRETSVDPMTIVQLVQHQPERYRLAGATELKFTAPMESADKRLETVAALLDTLQTPAASRVPPPKKAAGHKNRH